MNTRIHSAHITLILFLALFMPACINENEESERTHVVVQSASKDLIRLAKYFERNGGRLFAEEDRLVRWYDTEIYRIYEFKYHAVVVYPIAWTEDTVNLSLFAGHFASDMSMICENGSLFFEHEWKDENNNLIKYYETDIAVSIISQIGFDGVHLMQRRDKLYKMQTEYINNKWANNIDDDIAKAQIEQEVFVLKFDPPIFYRNGLQFQVKLIDEQVRYIEFRSERYTGIGAIQTFIKRPRIIPIIDKGEFLITKEMAGGMDKMKEDGYHGQRSEEGNDERSRPCFVNDSSQ